MSLYSHNNFYIDIAIIYAILNFIASFAFANYLTNKNQETGNE
jgi:multisubunit Na+/H+ antiporter MnhF subunit